MFQDIRIHINKQILTDKHCPSEKSHNEQINKSYPIRLFDFSCKNYLVACDKLALSTDRLEIIPNTKKNKPFIIPTSRAYVSSISTSTPYIQLYYNPIPTNTTSVFTFLSNIQNEVDRFREVLEIYLELLNRTHSAHLCNITLFHIQPKGQQLLIPHQNTTLLQVCPSEWCLSLSLLLGPITQSRPYLTNIFASVGKNNIDFWAYKHVDVFLIKSFLNSSKNMGFTNEQCNQIGEQFINSISFLLCLWPKHWISLQFTKTTIHSYIRQHVSRYVVAYTNILPNEAISKLIANAKAWDVYGATVFCLHQLLSAAKNNPQFLTHPATYAQSQYEQVCLKLMNEICHPEKISIITVPRAKEIITSIF